MMVVSSELLRPGTPALLSAAGRQAAPAAGDSEASRELAELYTEHFAFVWRSARRLGVPLSAVDDAVQDVFLVAHRKLTEFEGCRQLIAPVPYTSRKRLPNR